MVVSLLIGLGLALLIGGGAMAWLWLVQRPRLERDHGLSLLSAMRWREFSKMVVDGLRTRGFEPEAAEEAAERGQDSVIHLRRDGREWLLACKQGTNYRITPTVVGDITDAVRFHGADGGVVATPGSADNEARRLAKGRVELIDGNDLWPLVRLQLAPGVRDEIWSKSRQVALRQSTVACAAALTLGLLVAWLLPRSPAAPADPEPVAVTTTSGTLPTAEIPDPTFTPAPATEEERRTEVARLVSTLPGVQRAAWTSRSTLMVDLANENADPYAGICGILEKFEELRTSRLHLQPPVGATKPARFLQCRAY